MSKKTTETAPAKSSAPAPAPAEEAVKPEVAAKDNGVVAVVAADGVVDQAKNDELAKRQAIAEIEAEEREKALADIEAGAAAKRDEMVLKYKEEKRAEVAASMRDRLSLERELELQEEARVQAAKAVEAEIKAAKAAQTDETWKKDKNAEIDRVFRSCVFKNGVAVRNGYTTLNRQAGSYKGTDITALTIVEPPNHADQYVLKFGAIDYADQLAAYRRLEKMEKVVEIDPKFKGVPFIPESEKRIRTLQTQLDALIAKR